MSAQLALEQRTAERIGVRTPVVVYFQTPSGQIERLRAWTDDLSTLGAKITTQQPLAMGEIYLRVMLPDLKDQVIVCEVVREIPPERGFVSFNFDIRRSFYGVRFLGLAEEQVIAAIGELDKLALTGAKS